MTNSNPDQPVDPTSLLDPQLLEAAKEAIAERNAMLKELDATGRRLPMTQIEYDKMEKQSKLLGEFGAQQFAEFTSYVDIVADDSDGTDGDLMKAVICIAQEIAERGKKKTINRHLKKGVPREEIQLLVKAANEFLVTSFGRNWDKLPAHRKSIVGAIDYIITVMRDDDVNLENAVMIAAKEVLEKD